MKNTFWILGVIAVIFVFSTIKTIFYYPETNKDERFSNVQNNTYQNTAYHFSMTFPEGWKVSSRELSDSQAIVQKAIKGTASISLAVREVPLVVDVLSSEDKTIDELVDFEEFKKETRVNMERALPGVRNFEFGQVFVDQLPAYWVKFSGPSSIDDTSSKDTVKQYQFVYKNVLYIVSTSADSGVFSAREAEFTSAINSFKIDK